MSKRVERVPAAHVVSTLTPAVTPAGTPASGRRNFRASAVDFAQPAAPRNDCLALDRSGSIQYTDPDKFEPSILDLFGDLEPNTNLTAYTFSGVGTAGVSELGEFNTSDPTQLQALREKVQQLASSTPSGWTPTPSVIQVIYQHLLDENAPAGSGCVIVSDGQPQQPGISTAALYAQIGQESTLFAQHHWLVSDIALGSGPFVPQFEHIAQKLGGLGVDAANPSQLLSLGIELFDQFDHAAPPRTSNLTIGPSGSARLTFGIDPTIQNLTVVATREGTSISVRLLNAHGNPVTSASPNVVRVNSEDEHYTLWHLFSSASLGAGSWSVVVQGPVGTVVPVAISERSDLSVRIVQPTSTEVIAERPVEWCAELLKGSVPLTMSGATVTLRFAQGASPVALTDNGIPPDPYDADTGYFCGRGSVPPGGNAIGVTVTTPGQGKAETTQGIFAVALPAFTPIPQANIPTVFDGQSANLPFAQLSLSGGRVNPAIVGALTFVQQPPTGPARVMSVTVPAVLNTNGVVTASLPSYLADAAPGAPAASGGGKLIDYGITLEAGYKVDGQVIWDTGAAVSDLNVHVIPIPPICGLAAGGRFVCAQHFTAIAAGFWLLLAALSVLLLIAGANLWFSARSNRGLSAAQGDPLDW